MTARGGGVVGGRAASRRAAWLLAGLLAGDVTGLGVREANAQSPDRACPYRDEKGNCRAKPVFPRARTPRPRRVVIITSDPPGAAVMIDGVRQTGVDPDRGEPTVTTPMVLSQVRAGRHQLVLSMDRHGQVARLIDVAPSGTQRFGGALVAWPRLDVQLVWSEFYQDTTPAILHIDGERIGELPRIEAVEPGNHSVVVTREGYAEWEEFVRVKPGETLPLYVSLERLVGSLAIETNLPGLPARFVSQERCGRLERGEDRARRELGISDPPALALANLVTPLALREVPAGTYCVELSIAGVGAHYRLVHVERGKHAAFSFTLPIPADDSHVIPWLRGEWREARILRQCRAAGRAMREDDADPHAAHAAIDIGETCFRLGVSLHEQRQLAGARDALAAGCALDQAKACEALGWMQAAGEGGGAADSGAARQQFGKACLLGMPRACYRRHFSDEDNWRRNPFDGYVVEDAPGFKAQLDSLAYQPWFSLRLSSPLAVGSAGFAHLELDVPAELIPHVGSALAGNAWAFTAGARIGGAWRGDRDADTDEGGVGFDAAAVFKLKTVVGRRLYFDLEARASFSGTRERGLGAAMGWRVGRDWIVKAGVETAGAPWTDDFGDGARAFVTVGPAMGWVLQ